MQRRGALGYCPSPFQGFWFCALRARKTVVNQRFSESVRRSVRSDRWVLGAVSGASQWGARPKAVIKAKG